MNRDALRTSRAEPTARTATAARVARFALRPNDGPDRADAFRSRALPTVRRCSCGAKQNALTRKKYFQRQSDHCRRRQQADENQYPEQCFGPLGCAVEY